MSKRRAGQPRKHQPLKRRKSIPKRSPDSVEETAQALFAEGKHLEALHLLDDVVDRGEATPSTWKLIGKGLLQVREFAQSIGPLEQAGMLDPDATNQRIKDVRCEFAQRLAAAEKNRYTTAPNVSEGRQRLRVGYVSGFFRFRNYMKPV